MPNDFSPTERELDVLKVLWAMGEAKVRDVHAVMASQEETAFTTVQTLLRIMADKKLVACRNENRTLFYRAKYSSARAASRFLRKVFDGSVDRLVMSMLETESISPAELRQMEDRISAARKKRGRKEGS